MNQESTDTLSTTEAGETPHPPHERSSRLKVRLRGADECPDAICRDTLATHVDTFIYQTTFAPLMVPRSKNPSNARDYEGIGLVSGQSSHGSYYHIARMIYINKELDGHIHVPSLEQLIKAIDVQYDENVTGAEALASSVKDAISREAPSLYASILKKARQDAVSRLRDNGKLISTAPNDAEALKRMGLRYCKDHKLFPMGYADQPLEQRRSEEELFALNGIGFLFLERLRIRPIGHTVERAPFYELSLQPGETVTLRQKSFSKRAMTLERATEETEERRLEYSSTFTTELAEEYARSLQESDNWGVTGTVSGTLGSTSGSNIAGSVTGNYGASTTETNSTQNASKKAQTLSRKVETSQKISHKTVLTIGTEETLEEESIKVIHNDNPRAKKILMRKLMQVLHLSYERYGVRMCWAPCVKDPGRDVRAFVPGPNSFPDETNAIKSKWANMPPTEELGPPPSSQTVYSQWTGELSGGLWGMSENWNYNIVIPSSYEFEDAFLEFDPRVSDEDPNVNIPPGTKPPRGSTGVVTIVVHIGLSGGVDAGNVRFRVGVLAAPGSGLRDQRQAAVDSWRQQQAEKEIQDFLKKKKEELAGVQPNAWPTSELMRRIINEYFAPASTHYSCELVAFLHRIFEWENLSYEIYAPWWNSNTPVDGLQSLRTNFLNASWARTYIPIRPGFEEEAISILLAIGGIPNNPEWLDDLQYYIQDLRQNVEPMFRRSYTPTKADEQAIDSPCDLVLTTLGSSRWENEYEKESSFKVLDRFTVTIPTDGVDYEEQFARCDATTPSSEAAEHTAVAHAELVKALSQRIKDGDGNISINVSEPKS